MSRKIKLILYVICLIGVVVLGTLTSRSYREAAQASERRTQNVGRVASVENTNVAEATNMAAADTNLAAVETNAALALTNLATTNATQATNAIAAQDSDGDEPIVVAGSSARGYTRMVIYGLGLLLFLIGLAALIAYDVSQFLGQRAQQALFSDDGAPVSAEYEQAEELAKDGKYLEAIQAMRDYLKAHPREQYIALRIAEIYEQNLFNPLAAALEYEEVLTKPLPPERWGWAAIHLANLYSGKLNQAEKSVAVLRRIDAEYGQTSAARKARERLAQVDPGFVPSNVAEMSAATEAVSEERPASNLPPGFRPKT